MGDKREMKQSKQMISLPGLAAMLLSMVLTGFGVCIFVECNIGSDTLTVLLDGVRQILHTSLGNGSRICNITILIIAMLVNRKAVGLETILYALLIGFFIDLAGAPVASLSLGSQSLFIKLLAIGIAQLFFAFGFAIMIKADSGIHAIDAAVNGIVEKSRFTYPFVRTMVDVIFVVGGMMMGGVAGVGTIIACLTTGLLITSFKKLLKCAS